MPSVNSKKTKSEKAGTKHVFSAFYVKLKIFVWMSIENKYENNDRKYMCQKTCELISTRILSNIIKGSASR